MGARGVFYALNEGLGKQLMDASVVLTSATPAKRIIWFLRGLVGIGSYHGPAADRANEMIEDLIAFELWNATSEKEKCPVDKAWYAIHLILSNGREDARETDDPLEACVLGGKQLYRGQRHIVAMKDVDQVARISDAIHGIDKNWLLQQYDHLMPQGERNGPEDHDYTWSYFDELRSFYREASNSKHAVIFHVSL